MLIMTAVLGVAAVGIAAVTMDSEPADPRRAAYKARFAFEQAAFDDMSDSEKMEWVRRNEEDRGKHLVRKQSLGEPYKRVTMFSDDVMHELRTGIAASKGNKPAGSSYTALEDGELRNNLVGVREKNRGYKVKAIDELALERNNSLVRHRLQVANADGDLVEREIAYRTAKNWDDEFGSSNAAAVAQARVAIDATTEDGRANAAQAAFQAELDAIPEAYDEAHLEALKTLKDGAAGSINLDAHRERCDRMLKLLRDRIEAQLGKSDADADDDIAREDYIVYKRYCNDTFPDLLQPIASPLLNNVSRTAELLQSTSDAHTTERNVATLLNSKTHFKELLKRRKNSREAVMSNTIYIAYAQNIAILKSIVDLYAAFDTAQDHMKISIVCTADYVKDVNGLPADYVYPQDVAQMENDVRTLATNEIRAIAAGVDAATKVESARLLLMRTKGRVVDVNAIKAVVVPELQGPWNAVRTLHATIAAKVGVLDESRDLKKSLTRDEGDVLRDMFLEVRSKMTQYWGVPADTDFADYSIIHNTVIRYLNLTLDTLSSRTKSTLDEKITKSTTSFAEEYGIISAPYTSPLPWNPETPLTEKKTFIIDRLFPVLYDIEESLPTVESSRLLILLNLQAGFNSKTSNADKIRYIEANDVNKIVEFPEVYFQAYADAVYTPYVADVARLIASVNSGNGHDALEVFGRLPAAVQKSMVPAQTRIAVSRMKNLKSLLAEIHKPPNAALPAEFYIHKTLELYSLYKTREHDWGLNVADNFGYPATFLDSAKLWVSDQIAHCNGLAAPTLDDKEKTVLRVLSTVRRAHADLVPVAAVAGGQTFADMLAEVTAAGTPIQNNWAAVVGSNDDDVPEDFSAKGRAFNDFVTDTTMYWPNVDTLFRDFTVIHKKVVAVRDAIISISPNVTDDLIVNGKDIFVDTPEFPYSFDLVKSFVDCTEDVLACSKDRPNARFMDMGRYSDDYDSKRFDALDRMALSYISASVDDRADLKYDATHLILGNPVDFGFA